MCTIRRTFFVSLLIILLLYYPSAVTAAGTNGNERSNTMADSLGDGIPSVGLAKSGTGEFSAAHNETSTIGDQKRLMWSNAIYGIFFIAAGLLEVFYGYKYIRVTLLIVGFIFWSSTATVVILMTDNIDGKTHSVFFSFMVWLLAGLAGGLLSFFFWHLGIMLTAAYGAFAFSISLLALAQIKIIAVRYTIIGISIIAASLITHFYLKHVIIVSTSIGGSFAVAYGIDEFTRIGLHDMVESFFMDGEWEFSPNAGIYVLIGCGIVLAICGMIFEYKSHQVPIPDIKLCWCCGKKKDSQDEQSDEQDGEKPVEKEESIVKTIKNGGNEDLESGNALSVRDELEDVKYESNIDRWTKTTFRLLTGKNSSNIP